MAASIGWTPFAEAGTMRIWAIAGAVLLFANHAGAAIVPLEQGRSVISFGTATTIDESHSDGNRADAPDFGPFSGFVGHAARAGAATADGFAQQISVIKPYRVDGTFTADAFVGAFGFDDSADAGSSSNFDFSFEVDEAAPFRIHMSGSSSNNGYASMMLASEPLSDAEFFFDSTGFPEVRGGFNAQPGYVYRIVGSASASGFFSGGDGQVDGQAGMGFTLRQVPEPSTFALGACLLALGALAKRRR
jgi:hypothetical protein